jgi:hypothetical protein
MPQPMTPMVMRSCAGTRRARAKGLADMAAAAVTDWMNLRRVSAADIVTPEIGLDDVGENHNAFGFRVGGAELEPLDEGEGLVQLGEEGFVGFEFAGMDAAAEATHLYGMLEVEHLVVEQIFDGVARA